MKTKHKQHSKRIILFAIVILLALSGGAWYVYNNPLLFVDVPLTSLEEELDVTTLDNGMLVTIKETHNLPLVTIQFWVHAGSKNEPEAYRGIAHIFEHIWFKGTATQPVGSFHTRVESLGGDLNAMTFLDWTMYFVVVPSDKFDDIFPYMADLLLNPLFDETEIEKEKEVVLEEQRMSQNVPEQYIDEQFGLLLIDEHPYKHPVIGYKSTISAVDRKAIMDFYNTWYVPNNMNVVIVGDVERNDILQKITNAFGGMQSRALPPLNLPEQEEIVVPKYKSDFRDVGYAYVATGYLGPDSKDPDRYAMHVLNAIWSSGESSRLQQIVKKQKNIIVKGNSIFYPLNDMGVLEVVTVVEPDLVGQAKAEILLQLNRFKAELVSDEELERAKRSILADRVRSHEDNFYVGRAIGEAWIDGDVQEYSRFISHINDVTKEDVKRVAREYFNGYTMYELKPRL